MTTASAPKNREGWLQALDSLPAAPARIPAFFFAHGSPFLAFPESETKDGFAYAMGPNGPLGSFLKDFGPALLKKFNPKGIAVFSAHWETTETRVVTDYGDENPLLYDYYGFSPELYQLKFKSRGDPDLSRRIVQLYEEAGYKAQTTSKLEPRGSDGRGFQGPGLDHGVFVPFRLMFGLETDIPIVEISIDSSLDPEKNWAIGRAVKALRDEGILVLSGGLTLHNLRDFSSFSEDSAGRLYLEFDKAVVDSIKIEEPQGRKDAMKNLTQHRGFKAAHPRADHFVPLYVAAGAGEGGEVKLIAALHGALTVAFGL